jgi:predicted ATPase/DNA-binding CsgD family transcriptional regulator
MTTVLPGNRPANIPLSLTPFLGREREIAIVAELLQRDDVRLLTLAGTGGVGKTRLALRVAGEIAPRFADGVVVASLAAVRDPGLVASAIAEALGLEATGDEPLVDQLTLSIAEREILLVLDNFEQVVDAAPLLSDLLTASSDLKLLVTSRSLLRLSGEHVFTVPPLGLPSADLAGIAGAEAVRLFVDRAQAARSDFALTGTNAAAVAGVCSRLDGLPLAIELAAARVATLPPSALLSRMERRLPLLTSGTRDAPTRQQTMRATIAWSHDLLAPDEQTLFRRLSVFAGGFTLDAAEAVGGQELDRLSPCPPAPLPPFDGIASLVEKSLIGQASGEPRYTILETIREFGAEQLAASGEESSVRGAHAEWVLDFAERAEPELSGPDQAAWMARIKAELGNIRAALRWLQERGDTGKALRLAGAIGWFWSSPGYFHEGRDLFAGLFALPGVDDHPAPLAKALWSAGDIADWLGDSAQATTFFERATEIYRTLGDDRKLAGLLRGLGSIAIDQEDSERATTLLEDALARATASGDAWEAAAAANLLGGVAVARGDYVAAMLRHEEAANGWRALNDPGHVVTALASLAVAALAGEFYDRARAASRAWLDLATKVGDHYYLVRALASFGALATARGDAVRGARLLAAAARQTEAIGAPLRPATRATFDRYAAQTRIALGDAAFATAWEEGERLSFEDALAEARAEAAETNLGVLSIAPPLRHSLTEREIDVLRLVAAGLTDQEIADHLQIVRRTASKHVSAILAKLGVRTRRAAVQAATRIGAIGTNLPA